MTAIRIAALTAFAASLAVPAQAQPFSESMADCAAVYQNGAQWVTTDAQADAMMVFARDWADAAVLQHGREGREVSIDAVWQSIDAKTDAWDARGTNPFFDPEYMEWVQYCEAFGREMRVGR